MLINVDLCQHSNVNISKYWYVKNKHMTCGCGDMTLGDWISYIKSWLWHVSFVLTKYPTVGKFDVLDMIWESHCFCQPCWQQSWKWPNWCTLLLGVLHLLKFYFRLQDDKGLELSFRTSSLQSPYIPYKFWRKFDFKQGFFQKYRSLSVLLVLTSNYPWISFVSCFWD